MTVKDQDGKVIFSKTEDYEVYDLHLPQNKDGWLGFDDWDITAMTHINLGLEPFETDSRTYVVPLNSNTKAVDVEASFMFHYEEDQSKAWETVKKKVEF